MPDLERLAATAFDRIEYPPSSRTRRSAELSPSGRIHRGIGIVVSLESRLFRESLSTLLSGQPDFHILGMPATPAGTVALCATLQPQVLLLGILATWPKNLSPIAAVRLVSPTTRILALAPHGRDRCAYLNPPAPSLQNGPASGAPYASCLPKVFASGALGALDGDSDPETLYAAVRAVARGEPWGVNEEAPPVNAKGNSLSPQELKVAWQIGQGSSNKEIATHLDISDLTVKKHLSSIFQKLELQDRLQLGLRVARNPAAFDGD
jgi:DNA-binding NarL/FixJ family response regulator